MMFGGDDALKKIEVLSGGEKSRVLLGKILIKPCHLLLLDEPTNHLDMESCEGLIDAVNEFNGSVIMVTHNEELLHNIAERLIIFDRGQAFVFEGTYKDFLESRGWEDESGDIKAKGGKKEKIYTREELKKIRANLIQEKSKVLKPLEESVAKIEKEIVRKEKEMQINTDKMVEASISQDIAFLAEGPKTDKLLKSELEKLYSDLAVITQEFEEKSEIFRLKMMEIEK